MDMVYTFGHRVSPEKEEPLPWGERTTMDLRLEFISLARTKGANISELSRRFGISRRTAYDLLERYTSEGPQGLFDRSRRPLNSPRKTAPEVEAVVLAVRDEHPRWGGRKIRRRLLDLGELDVPSVSTVNNILKREGRIDPAVSGEHRAFRRFEQEAPNILWQMDFKGHFALLDGRCHALTVLDDHSRFALGLRACSNERGGTVQGHLTEIFRRYGLPERMLMDNGSPWGSDAAHIYTPLTVWLMRLGIEVCHSRPYHPQTQGKAERFHRTLKAELLSGRFFRDLDHCQEHFDHWRQAYNLERPHEALSLATPASHYTISLRVFPEVLPAIEYDELALTRRVSHDGIISYRNRTYRAGRAFAGSLVALRPAEADHMDILFGSLVVGRIDLNKPKGSVNYVSDHL